MREISPEIADETLDRRDPEWLRKVLERAASVWREKYAHAQDSGGARTDQISSELLKLLAQALGGPSRTRYRCPSSSKPGSFYTLEANSTDITCTCPGFEYRGMCRHARELQNSLVKKGALPAAYEPL